MAEILSPLPGIFYRRPAPDKDVFVNEGDTVTAGQTIGIVEIMKQFSEVTSDTAGVLTEFRVAGEGAVSPGDVIAVVEAE